MDLHSEMRCTIGTKIKADEKVKNKKVSIIKNCFLFEERKR